MAASLIDLLREQARQQRTGDSQFASRGTWLIRIVCTRHKPGVGPVGPDGQAIFVLPVAPNRFEYHLPFSRSVTAEQQGGVVVERQGLVTGEISMSATTGFKLRPQASTSARAAQPRFTGPLATTTVPAGTEISGQLHLWSLLNRCFEGYAELCRDADTAPHTQMELHVLKDQLHLVVEPGKVRVSRSAASERVTYSYDLDFTVLGTAQPQRYTSPDQRSIVDAIADAVRTMREAVQSLAATVDDLTAAIDTLTRISRGFVGLIDDLGSIVRAGSNVLDATGAAFALPQTALAATSDFAGDMAALCEALPAGSGVDAARSLRRSVADIDSIALAARAWHTATFSGRAASYNATTITAPTGDTTATEQAGIDRAAGLTAGTTATLEQAFGARYRPGDARRQVNGATGLESRIDARALQSTYQATVEQGDTITTLAARLLGDGRRWIDLAVVNGLAAPYVTDGAKLPGTLAPGDQITVPSPRPTGAGASVLAGNEPEATQSEAALGVDLALTPTAGGQWDLALDAAGGSVDALPIAGLANLGQAIATRLRLERGELPLQPDVGLPRLVGVPAYVDASGMALLHVREQIYSDDRVLALGAIAAQLDHDVLTLELSVVPAGIGEARTLTQAVP